MSPLAAAAACTLICITACAQLILSYVMLACGNQVQLAFFRLSLSNGPWWWGRASAAVLQFHAILCVHLCLWGRLPPRTHVMNAAMPTRSAYSPCSLQRAAQASYANAESVWAPTTRKTLLRLAPAMGP